MLACCWKIFEEISVEESFNFFEAWKLFWTNTIWASCIKCWVVHWLSDWELRLSVDCWVSMSMSCSSRFVSWSFRVHGILNNNLLASLFLNVSFVDSGIVLNISVVLFEPPCPLSHKIIKEGVKAIELKVCGSCEAIVSGLNIISKV